jgi:hypothetical protein
MPMSPASGMQEALREVVGKEIMVVVISQCESPFHPVCDSRHWGLKTLQTLDHGNPQKRRANDQAQNQQSTHYTPKVVFSLISVSLLLPCSTLSFAMSSYYNTFLSDRD